MLIVGHPQGNKHPAQNCFDFLWNKPTFLASEEDPRQLRWDLADAMRYATIEKTGGHLLSEDNIGESWFLKFKIWIVYEVYREFRERKGHASIKQCKWR